MARKGWDFEAMVKKAQDGYDPDGRHLLSRDVVTLLARQHAAFVRLVKRMIAVKRKEIACIDDGLCDRDVDRPLEVHEIMREIQVCDDLLAALGKRTK
jgi:hypothetical protein